MIESKCFRYGRSIQVWLFMVAKKVCKSETGASCLLFFPLRRRENKAKGNIQRDGVLFSPIAILLLLSGEKKRIIKQISKTCSNVCGWFIFPFSTTETRRNKTKTGNSLFTDVYCFVV